MRKLVIIVLCSTVVLLTGYAGYRGYKVWKQDHRMKLAQQFLAKGDGRNALLSLKQVLLANPLHREATRLMADLAEADHSLSALGWRKRTVELNPKSLDDRLALARTALELRDYATATNALEGVTEAGRNTAAYHNTAGAVAVAANQLPEAQAHFSEAIRLEPQNPAPQISLAVVRLHGSNDLDLAEARITLQRISSNPTNAAVRCEALRELALDALHYKQSDTALALTRQLVQETNSVFGDRLLRLEALHATQSLEFKPALAAAQREAGTNRGRIYVLATWQIGQTGPAETLAWLGTLPKSLQTDQPVAFLATECLVMQTNWNGLQALLGKQNWADLEYLRHAYLTLALRGQNLAEAAKVEWNLALKAANDERIDVRIALVVLLRKAEQWNRAEPWNWRSEREEILWAIVNHYPNDKWAVENLGQTLFAWGRTRSLMALFSQQLKAKPADVGLKNNLAMTALLLDANELKPHDLAREVYQSAPTNSSYASTYAFSLHLLKKDADALKIMQQLQPNYLEDPTVAGYYGLILKAAGDRERARLYLDRTAKAQLLPEEKKLFDSAKAGV